VRSREASNRHVNDDFRYLLDLVPADMRDACAIALEEGRARGQGRELTGETPARTPEVARPRVRVPIPVHPETPPRWYREELAALARGDRPASNRKERRALEVSKRIADGSVEEVQRDAYRARQRAHQRAHRRRHRYLRQPAAPDGLAMGRAATAQQFIGARAALTDEWGARATTGAFPAPIAAKLAEWVREMPRSDAYASPWCSRFVRRTVSTLAAILFAARPSWRPGYALVTTGMGRERLAAIMGPAPESGRRFSVSSLSHVEYGSLAVLEELGILERTQLPGDAVPDCDRGHGFAFNHYLVRLEMCPAGDEWSEPSRLNPSIPRELLEEIAPWVAAPEGEAMRLASVRAQALTAALERVAGGELPELDAPPDLEDLEERLPAELWHPPPD